MRIDYIGSRIVDIPTIRPHRLSFGSINHQSYVVVQIRLSDGAVGYGEAATIGGASWGEESPETIKHIIDDYLSPAAMEHDPRQFERLLQAFERRCKGNRFAKAAVEMAVMDAVARAMNVPAYQFLGGKLHESLPIAWTLASGDSDRDIEEAEAKLAERKHRLFKVKIGAKSPEDDLRHIAQIARALQGRAEIRVDVNQAWDTPTARKYVRALGAAGVEMAEQPVASWNLAAMTDLSAQDGPAIMADESVCRLADALAVVQAKAAQVFSLKITKHGGLINTRKVAAIAEAAGLACYGGTMLETSLGSAASAHVFAGIPSVTAGCELFGPMLLTEDIVEEPMVCADFSLMLPDGPGFGVRVDESKLAFFDRANRETRAVTVDMGKGTPHSRAAT
jgi:muconate cycloisomerase